MKTYFPQTSISTRRASSTSRLQLVITAFAMSAGLLAQGCSDAMEQPDVVASSTADVQLASDTVTAPDVTISVDVPAVTDAADTSDVAATCPGPFGATACSVNLLWNETTGTACATPSEIDPGATTPISADVCARFCPAIDGSMPLTCIASFSRVGIVLRCSRC